VDFLEHKVSHIFVDEVSDMRLKQSYWLYECLHSPLLQHEVISLLLSRERHLEFCRVILFFSLFRIFSLIFRFVWILVLLRALFHLFDGLHGSSHSIGLMILKESAYLVQGMIPIVLVVRK